MLSSNDKCKKKKAEMEHKRREKMTKKDKDDLALRKAQIREEKRQDDGKNIEVLNGDVVMDLLESEASQVQALVNMQLLEESIKIVNKIVKKKLKLFRIYPFGKKMKKKTLVKSKV